MKTKLTLSINDQLVKFAHQQARQEGRSISQMVERYLERERTASTKKSKPSINDVDGVLAGLDIDTSKAGIAKLYAEKYLGRS